MEMYHPWFNTEPNNSPTDDLQYFVSLKYNKGIWAVSDLRAGKTRKPICEYEGLSVD